VYYVSTGGDPTTSIYFSQPGAGPHLLQGDRPKPHAQFEPWATEYHVRTNEELRADGSSANERRSSGVHVREKIEPGKFIFFPAYLSHYVLPHVSSSTTPAADDAVRAIIAWNMNIDFMPDDEKQTNGPQIRLKVPNSVAMGWKN
jgi:hypothetical protein